MRFFLSSILWILVLGISGQERYYSNPLKVSVLINGTFAELRSNHFHSGIDLRTEGRTGLKVHATAEGSISRIAVSPTGFGNAIYIDHPNGTTSVYGHLLSFRKDIQEYVKDIQYKKESFKVDLTLSTNKFKLKKGEFFALSGNSGSSGGPHLHFEIRDTHNQEPINPVEYGFYIKDTSKPRFLQLKAYPLGEGSHVNYVQAPKKYKTVLYNGHYHIKNSLTIPVFGEIGFAIETVDYVDGTWSKCGINKLSFLIDGKEEFSYNLKQFSFDQTRFINSHIDYGEYKNSYHRFQKAWKEPGNFLDIYGNNDGVVLFKEGQHEVKIIIEDSNGNESKLIFNVVGKLKNFSASNKKQTTTLKHNHVVSFEKEEVMLTGNAGNFYSNLEFEYDYFADLENSNIYSKIHQIHLNTTPIHKSLNLSIKPERLLPELQNKALLAIRNPKTGKLSSAGGQYKDGWVSGSIRSFGDYVVSIDTIPPTIRSLSIRSNTTLVEPNRIRFKIHDSFSGIKSHKGSINGKWALFKYDAKNNLLTYHIDTKRLEMKKKHSIKLVVTDNKNNTKEYVGRFYK